MFIVRYRKVFYVLSALLVLGSLGTIALLGLRPSIEFAGGALTGVRYGAERPAVAAVEERLNNLALGSYSLRPTEENGYLLRTRDLSDAEQEAVVRALSLNDAAELTVLQQSSIGPTLGVELRNKALLAIGLVVLGIILFIAYVFRKVSKPVASWKYGVIAVVALLHDIIIPTGLFALMGASLGTEIDVLFVVALLTILGYSVNDTIVVFDRVREHLNENQKTNRREDFELTVGKSLDQTIVRSINTSLTVVLVLLALFFFGASATQDFALALLAGVIAGTYSSVCLASPLLVTVERLGHRRTQRP